MQDILSEVPAKSPLLTVQPDWLDPNGHMNVAYYLRAFDLGSNPVFEALGMGWSYPEQGQGSAFTLESRLRYFKEVFEGDPLRVTFQLLDLDEKRLHFFSRMYQAEEGYLAATHETIVIHVNFKTRKASPFPPALYETLNALLERHRALPRPEGLEHGLSIRRKPAPPPA